MKNKIINALIKHAHFTLRSTQKAYIPPTKAYINEISPSKKPWVTPCMIKNSSLKFKANVRMFI